MSWIMSIVGYPLGYIMWAIYKVVPVYAVALILFTLITKLAMIPLSIKQQKSMAQQAMIQPKMAEIQKKYANNKQKQSEELNKLYSENNVSMTAGCLPLLIQFPILFGLIDVIYKPMTHILHFSKELIASIEAVSQTLATSSTVGSYASEITAFNTVKLNPQAFISGGISADVVETITNFNMSLGPFNLAETPTLGWNLLVIIPILSGLTALATSLLSMAANPQNAGGGTTKIMMLMMPLMSLWFTFKVPAGVGFYWILSNVFAAIQSAILNKYYNPKEMAAAAEAEMTAKKEAERAARIEAKRLAKERGENPDADEALSQKEIARRKLAEARKRNAEKYGDEYVEVTDADLK